MPFYPIDILPHHDAAQAQKLRARWETHEGRTLHEKIIGLIRKGGGEDFLQREFEQGRLSFLKDQWDLAGIKLSSSYYLSLCAHGFRTGLVASARV
jgi:hypothetical protein